MSADFTLALDTNISGSLVQPDATIPDLVMPIQVVY